MVAWLWHTRGSIELDDSMADAELLDRLKFALGCRLKPVVDRGPYWIEFAGPIGSTLGPTWDAITIYDRGRIWIERSGAGARLRYDLRSLHIFIFSLLCAGPVMAFGYLIGDIAGSAKLIPVGFAWFYGGNIATGLVRLPRFFRRAIDDRRVTSPRE